MLSLNIKNVEHLIFYDRPTRLLLSDLNSFFKAWETDSIKGLRSNVKKTLCDFLNSLDEKHINLLEKHFGETVKVDKIDYNLIKCFTSSLSEAECLLCGYKGYNNFTISRDGDYVYICFWR